MTVLTGNRVAKRIAQLNSEIAHLEYLKPQTKPSYREVMVRMRLKPRHTNIAASRQRSRVILNGGVVVTTRPGSLYATILKTLADQGHFELHAGLFAKITRHSSAKAACALLKKISVSRADLEKLVRADSEFREHCDARTREYRPKAALGSRKHQRILKDPKISARGRWIGDINEALNILVGGRSLKQLRRGKNVQILNRAKLMFDIIRLNSEERCVLFAQKWHAHFRRACELALLS